MNRNLWNQSLTKTSCPSWNCPVCKKGTATLVRDKLIYNETRESKRAHDHEAWDPDWIQYNFTAWAQCGHPSCKQDFAIAGVGGVEPESDPEGGFDWVPYFEPRFCHPSPEIIELPSKCPADVGDELRAAFSLFYVHRAACAGRIRVALECLMNHLGVPRKKRDKQGKFHDLNLHKRIDAFVSSEPMIGAQLMALKWLGNSGSHDTEISKSDLLDAFEIMEHALVEIIDRRSERVAALAKKLTRKHGR